MTQVQHDPFARGAYNRTCHGPGECKWCGQERRRLFSYVWISDAQDRANIFAAQTGKRRFCNFDCFKSYFG